jgi:ABC-2 type transport system ATP-binding protein
MLRFVDFKKAYGSIRILEIKELTIEPGIYWIRGANGSGKSTLLKTIAGILSFDGDIILKNNISIKKKPVAYRRLVNFAEAEPIFPEFLTGMEMINVFSTAKNAKKGQEEYFIESMGMQDYVHQPIGTYSSGMLKKISIVLAFLGDPELILLDEPLITIDAASLEIIYEWISEKHKATGCSLLLSSHQALEHHIIQPSNIIQVEHQSLKYRV